MHTDAHTYSPVALPAPPPEHAQHVNRRLRALMKAQNLEALAAFGPRNHYYASGMLHPLLYDGVPTGCAIAVVFAREEDGRGVVEMEFMAPGHDRTADLDIRTYSTWTYIDNPYDLEGIHLDAELTSTVSLDKALRTLRALLDDRPGISSHTSSSSMQVCSSRERNRSSPRGRSSRSSRRTMSPRTPSCTRHRSSPRA
jgi:hypothetical protein